MKRIGLLISAMNGGGAERVVSHLTHILGESYDVHLILFEDTYMEYACGGTLHTLNVPAVEGNTLVKLNLLRKRIAKMKALIRTEKLECVISFLDSPNFVNLLVKVPGCRQVISIRNYSELENQSSVLGSLTDAVMKLVYKRADSVVTVSKAIEESFHQHYGIPKEKLYTIYNPYNFADMRQKGEEPLSPEEEAFYRDHFVFANVGRIMHQKAIWHLVKAFSLVHAEHPEARLVVVGEDYTKGQLLKLIQQLGLEDSVLLTGRTRNPYKYLKRADCYVLSSLFEGFPNALVEAMACGCAVIATDCKSGPREILYEEPDLSAVVQAVTEADYGVLVPPLEDPENWDGAVITEGEKILFAAMAQMASDPERCQKWAEKATVRSWCFDFEAAYQGFSAVIDQ